MTKRPMILVLWEDAWHSDQTYTDQEIQMSKPFLVETIGFLIHENKGSVFLAESRNPNRDEHWRHAQGIPKSLIRERRMLK